MKFVIKIMDESQTITLFKSYNKNKVYFMASKFNKDYNVRNWIFTNFSDLNRKDYDNLVTIKNLLSNNYRSIMTQIDYYINQGKKKFNN